MKTLTIYRAYVQARRIADNLQPIIEDSPWKDIWARRDRQADKFARRFMSRIEAGDRARVILGEISTLPYSGDTYGDVIISTIRAALEDS